MRPTFLIASLWLAPVVAMAQSSTETLSAPPSATNSSAANPGLNRERTTQQYREIERGFFLGVDVGPEFNFNPPASAGNRPFSPGQLVRVEVGYEFNDRLALSIFVMGAANRAGTDYIGYSGGAASGDFSTLVPGVSLRFDAVGFPDSQGVQRAWFYVRGGVGYAWFAPKPLIPHGDIFVFVGPGIEYFTRLRHFSIGLEVTGSMLTGSRSFGLAVTPNLRYAF